MGCLRMKIPGWVLPLLAIEMLSLSAELILRSSISDTLSTLPLFVILLYGTEFIYSRGFKYTGISAFLGLIIGILKMNYIFYLEGLNGQGTMNGAYALFISLSRGIEAGFTADAVSVVSKWLARTIKNIVTIFTR